MRIVEVLNTAIKMEEEGHAFYMKAASMTESQVGREMYETLAQDEVRHKLLLEGLKRKATPELKDLDLPLPKDRLKSVFSSVRARIKEHVVPTSDDISALSFAMGKETESYEMYRDAAADSVDSKVKAVFERMAQEENQHFEILQDTKYYLEEYANWTIWEEGGPIEGG